MGSFLKFCLLFWKNFLIQKRKPIATTFEIGLPTLFSLILMFLRLRVSSTMHPDVTQWSPCNYRHLHHNLQEMVLAYSPENNLTTRIMKRVNQTLNMMIEPFSSEEKMVNFITLVNNSGGQHINNSDVYLGGVVFDQVPSTESNTLQLNRKMNYKIRLSYAPRLPSGGNKFALTSDTSWSTGFMFPPYQVVGPRKETDPCNGDPGYKREGFLAIQHAVYDSLMHEYLTGEALERYKATEVLLRRHPYPPYVEDNYVLVLQQQFPLVIMLSFVVPVLGIVRDIALEKERRLKESMKMMGISNWLHWVAWFVKHFLFLLISVIIMTIFFCVKIDSEKGGVLARTHPMILFLYLMCFAVATITYCFAVSVFFARANTAAALGGVLFFCCYIPYFFLQRRYSTLSFTSKVVACLDFQVAMAFGGSLLGIFEGVGEGVQFYNISKGVSVDDDFSMIIVLIMLLVDSVIYYLIAWYVEAVIPGEYGVPQPFYFPFLPSYWGCSRHLQDYSLLDNELNIGQDPSMFEKEPIGENAGIRIRNLRKVYGSGSKQKVAIAGMTLNMYEGQITALLGHNGAGKTTTMSILTGFYPPTSGTAIVNGFDICTEINEVRNSLGLCPQHDILFDNLTVEEHMYFFGLLKGVPQSEVIPQCTEMLKDMELFQKLKAKSKTLSGGMKRKLSVCIALIGNSKIVFLDEPTSGLDPNARRNIWTVLQKNRVGRTMVLSTHYMDEADLLGDRIAIMAEGIVKCCGTSLFLKKKYGAGYHMVIVKDRDCNVKQITHLVKTHINQAEMESNVGAELNYILPQNSVGSFEALFSELEDRQKELGIRSFGASVTTMEEVFLKVGESLDLKATKSHQSLNNDTTGSTAPLASNFNGSDREPLRNSPHKSYGMNTVTKDTSALIGENGVRDIQPYALDLNDCNGVSSPLIGLTTGFPKTSGFTLYMQQFIAMFIKRVLHTLRNKLVTITQLVIPLFFTVMGIVVLKTLPTVTDSPSLCLNVQSFGSNYLPYSSSFPEGSKMGNQWANQFQNVTSAHVININEEPGYENNSDLVRYLAETGIENIGTYNLKYMIAAAFNNSNADYNATVTAYFNNQAYHSIAISLGAMFNGLLQYFGNSSDYSVETINHPLPRLMANKIQDERDGKDFTGFTLAFNICFGMAFLASSFVLFLVKERSVKAKHIQFVSGVHPVNFWLSTLCWDLINFIIPSICLIITFFAFSITNFTNDMHWAQLVLFFLLYGWSILPYMYFMSFAFTVPSTAYVWITMFNILTGVATLLVVVILSIPQIGLEDVSIVLKWIFLVIFPNFCLSQGIFDFYQNYEYLNICKPVAAFCDFLKSINSTNPCCPGNCGDFCLYPNQNFLGWEQNGIGRMLIFLSIQGLLMWAFIFAYEYGLLQKLMYKMSPVNHVVPAPGMYTSQLSRNLQVQEDDDVAQERLRIENSDKAEILRSNKLVLDNLTKYYGPFRAVDHLSIGIPPGECFGLLGINGAGKSSTFMMLTGDTTISSGDAYLDSYSLKTNPEMAHKKLGYCPQFDALIDQMTGREILTLFAQLRGIMECDIPSAVSSMMNALTLTPHADKECRTYSGGNKRKLSTGIALIGDPEVIFLDEPTTGMDPVARRMLWKVLAAVRDSGRTLILTSHSMEECEALCTSLAIMVSGQFKCLGSIQHLKNKFGKGYTLSAKVAYPTDGSEPDLMPLQAFIDSTFPSSKLTDIHENMVNYHIMETQLSWAQVFGEMERAKVRLHIEDYLIGQTSLEQVFIYFARMQSSDDVKPGSSNICSCCCLPWLCKACSSSEAEHINYHDYERMSS